MDLSPEIAWLLEEPLGEILEAAPEPIRDLIEIVGLEAALAVLDRWRGQQHYFGKPDSAFKGLFHRRIRREYEAMVPANTLARRYNLSVSRIYEICREQSPQESLFSEP